MTDPVRLKQILLNFCSNAIKFTANGEVRLEVRFDRARDALVFQVVDSGIGMSGQELARLYRPFVQADVSTTRKYGGTGLGLYISKQLADMLGGQIEVWSAPGKGSRFSLSVPVGTQPRESEMLTCDRDFDDFQRPAFQITAVDVPNLNGRVLVAEDGADNQRLLGCYLRAAGVEFDVVGNGRLAVEHALAHEYALVLMDIQMPVMDGVAATEMLRRSSYRGPIVAVTANVMQDDVALYRKSGCTDVLAKPIDRTRFYEVLRQFVDAPRSHPQAAEAAYQRELAGLTADFERGLPLTFAAIDSAILSSDWAAVRSLLHALKGTAGSYGLEGLSKTAAEAEHSLSIGRTVEAARLCSRLCAYRPTGADAI